MFPYNKNRKIPAWQAEHVHLSDDLYQFTIMTLHMMQNVGRVRNLMQIEHSGKMFVQFERKQALKFKRIRN